MRRLDGQSVSRDAHIVKHRELKSSALEKVRASAYGLPRRKKSWTTRAFGLLLPAMVCTSPRVTFRTPTHRVSPPSVEAAVLSF